MSKRYQVVLERWQHDWLRKHGNISRALRYCVNRACIIGIEKEDLEVREEDQSYEARKSIEREV